MKKFVVIVSIFFSACSQTVEKMHKPKIPLVGFFDLLQDETLAQAKTGFFDALKDSGFSEKDTTLEVVYRNAQGEQSTLIQACDYIISQNPDLIATCPTISTITAVKRTKSIPIFMMVSPRPVVAKLTNEFGRAPRNLFGTFETLEYIDTSVAMIKTVLPAAKKIGTIFNQSEPQSVDAMNRVQKSCDMLGLQLIKLPVNSSNEAQLVVEALLSKKIDAFFALPDNTVFAGMEVIVKSCDKSGVPVFTSEEGLVKRGAVAAFGADMYHWGYQSGAQAAQYLRSNSTEGIIPQQVQVRRRVYSPEKAQQFNLSFDSTFTSIK
jgi:putative ABC transport system substrate-binding protein